MIPLDLIQVPKPCDKDWDLMDGDDRRRFCAGCGCHVHDLSALTRSEAQVLLDQAEGRLCVRFQMRPDGTPLILDTASVPDRPRFWPRRLAAAASWMLALALTGLGLTARAATAPHKAAHTGTSSHAARKQRLPLMGKIAPPRSLQKNPAPGKKSSSSAPKNPVIMTTGVVYIPPPSVTMGAPLPMPPTKK